MDKIQILNSRIPKGYKFNLRKQDDKVFPYKVCLEPVEEGFKFSRGVSALDPEEINEVAEQLRKELWNAKVDAALDDGPVLLLQKP